MPINEFKIVRCLYNNLGYSFLKIGETEYAENPIGNNNAGGFTVSKGIDNITMGNSEIKEIIIRKVVDTPANEAIIYNYLKVKYNL